MTRFYFSAREQADILPAWHSGWTNVNATGTPKFKLRREPFGNIISHEQFNKTKAVATNPTNSGIAQFVSDPFPATGSVPSGTPFSVVVGMAESSTSADAFIRIVIRIVSNDGSTVRGVLYEGPNDLTVSTSPTANNLELETIPGSSRKISTTTSSTVAWQAGDRLVVEIGARYVQATTTGTASAYFLVNADYPDYPVRNGIVLNNISKYAIKYRPWFEITGIDFFPLDLGVEEFRYSIDGYALNGPSTALPFVDLTKIDGLDNAPIRQSSTDREGMHGGYVSAEFEGIRTVTLEGTLYCSPSALESQLDLLKKNFAPKAYAQNLYFGTDNGIRYVRGKSLGLRFTKERSRSYGLIFFQVQIQCADPRIYSDTDVIVTTSNTLTVDGNRTTPPIYVVTVSASVVNPSITHSSINNTWQYTYNGTLTTGDALVIDIDARTAILNGNTNVRSLMTLSNGWGELEQGLNTFTISSGLITIEKTYRPAWW